MAELLTWQTHMMQTYRENLTRRRRNYANHQELSLPVLPYPPYQIHYDQH